MESKSGPPVLHRDVLFRQKQERAQKAGVAVPASQLRQWINQLNASIRNAKGDRRQQLTRQRDALNKLL